MAMTYITFPYDSSDSFYVMLDKNMALVQKLFNVTFNHQVRVEKISFIDYENKRVFPSFPFEKRLCIHNTSTLETFGHGRYAGYFFDVIVRLANGNPMNYRIFYSIEEFNEIVNEIKEPGVNISDDTLIGSEVVAPTTLSNQDKNDTINTMFILGEERPFFKRGRATYIEYNGSYISLTEAKKIEKHLSN